MSTPGDLLITDMSVARPSEAYTAEETTVFSPISKKPAGGWRLIEFESELYNGRFLQSNDPKGAVLTIPLGLTGWHALSIGLAAAGTKPPQVCALEVRLTGQRRWQIFQVSPWEYLCEEPWLMGDLTGKSLEVRYPKSLTGSGRVMISNGVKIGPPALARLFSIRAVPMVEADVKAVRTAESRNCLYGTDGHGVLLASHPKKHQIRHFFREFAGGDWNLSYYGGGGSDIAFYDTKVGELFGAEGSWDCDTLQLAIANNLREMIRIGMDPLSIAVEQSHKQKHPIFVYIRNAGWICEPPLDQVFRSKWYSQHPEYCLREANGRVIGAYLSIAFPEVRERMNAMLREYLTYDADGVAICFVRGFPLVRYEDPVLERYRELHGGDARAAAPHDPRIRGVWAEFATRWVREVRKLADDAGPSSFYGNRRVLVMVGPNPEWCLSYGIDVQTWAREGLIDVVMPYPRGIETNGDDVAVSEFAELLRGTNVQMLPSLGSYADHSLSIYDYRRRAHLFYSAGADGLSRWDTDPRLARLGFNNSERQRLWIEKYMPPKDNTLVSMAGLERVIFSPRHGV